MKRYSLYVYGDRGRIMLKRSSMFLEKLENRMDEYLMVLDEAVSAEIIDNVTGDIM